VYFPDLHLQIVTRPRFAAWAGQEYDDETTAEKERRMMESREGGGGPWIRSGIIVVPGAEAKVVVKPWGWEKWLAGGGPAFPYLFKIIRIRAPHRTSLQFHRLKRESNHLLEGRGLLHYSENPIEAARFTSGGYSAGELEELVRGLRVRPLAPGDTVHVGPGCLHRIEAVEEDITLVETSTDHADDVYRLQDDAGRPHGRIDTEHL
jgi:hypothetical protein